MNSGNRRMRRVEEIPMSSDERSDFGRGSGSYSKEWNTLFHAVRFTFIANSYCRREVYLSNFLLYSYSFIIRWTLITMDTFR